MITRSVITVMIEPVSCVVHSLTKVGPRPAMILTKMISDIPLPIPRCVSTSPIHMMRIAPVRSTRTTMMLSSVSDTPCI